MDDETPLNDAVLDERAVVALMYADFGIAGRKQD